MHPLRFQRLVAVVLLLCGSAVLTGLVLYALRENVNLFYPPKDFLAGNVAEGRVVRLGAMVVPGSLRRDGVVLHFRVGTPDAAVEVSYSGLTPDLFAEGRGVVATGTLAADGVFYASSLLAKHDENYRPPELREALP